VASGGITESYIYDADGERVAKTVSGVTTVYFLGLWEQTVGGASKLYYTFNGQVVAMRDTSTNTVTYLHGDHLGSVSLATNSSGQVVSRQDFDPWGKARGASTIAQTSLNYTGQRLDGTGLLYFHARYYDPVLARFVSADTIVPGQDSKTGTANPQNLNHYSYVGNNPLTRTDPSGHDWDHLAQFAIGVAEGVGHVAVSTVQAAADSILPITAVKQTVEFVSDPSGYVSSRVQAVADTATTAWAGAQSAYNDPSGAVATLYDNSRAVGQVMGEALGTAALAKAIPEVGACSFSANTLVATDHGAQPIGLLRVGEYVYAYDQSLNITGRYQIQAVLVHTDPVIEELTIDGETVTTTPNHPFYTIERGWIHAGDLHIGDHIRKEDGHSGKVLGFTLAQRPQVMYNLTVAQAHTFFVGTKHWLVHNAKCLTPNQMNQAIQKGQAPEGIVRVDTPKIPNELLHVHFDNDAALNIDGSWKHGSTNLTKSQAAWLKKNGWDLP
jgi:RHS repeat-associated protein